MTKQKTINTLIVGAGDAGRLVADDLLQAEDSSINLVGFVDDNIAKQGTQPDGIPVLGSIVDIPALVKEYNVDELLIALPSQRGELIRRIVRNTAGLGLVYKTLPRAAEILHQEYEEDYIRYIRKVQPEDLLGGEILKSDQRGVSDYTKGKTILVTGAAGSIGSELSKQLASYDVEKAIFYDWWENGMFELRNKLIETHPERDFEFVIGDIKDKERLDGILKKYHPHTVFHAAAYKHVPLMEANATEAVKNNILGTKTVAELAIDNGVAKFILVSTDKAVNPTNVMGATKRAAEQIIHTLSRSQNTTTFCAVRFGNVINSNGSAIPFFLKQIAKGGPVTVTHTDITRYFMTIPEAVHLILRAWTIGENNDLFVLDMGEAVKIYELAETLIALEGYIPNEDIAIQIIGLRPGEKLFEELLMDQEDLNATAIEKLFRTQNDADFKIDDFLVNLSALLERASREDIEPHEIKRSLQRMVPTYRPANH